MNLLTFKEHLGQVSDLQFIHTDGSAVPQHFHITEAGVITKHFIDCGGTVRIEQVVNFQLWVSTDIDHRLEPKKLQGIISKTSKVFEETNIGIDELDIEVEYQSDTIGKYGLDFNDGKFMLMNKKTACLAQDQCGIPQEKPRVRLSSIGKETACCTPDSNCC